MPMSMYVSVYGETTKKEVRMKIRLDSDETLIICEHIELKVRVVSPDDYCDSHSEYVEKLTIHCRACHETHEYNVLIN